MIEDPDLADFPTSDESPSEEIRQETDKMLDEVLLTLKLERAVIFVKLDGSWQVSSAHEVPTHDFWNVAPLSLGVVSSAAKGETVNLMDAGVSAFASRDSVLLTGIRSVVCAPYTHPNGEVMALLYADNRIDKGAFSGADVATVQELAKELGRRLFES